MQKGAGKTNVVEPDSDTKLSQNPDPAKNQSGFRQLRIQNKNPVKLCLYSTQNFTFSTNGHSDRDFLLEVFSMINLLLSTSK
jgi:hypothetical protein